MIKFIAKLLFTSAMVIFLLAAYGIAILFAGNTETIKTSIEYDVSIFIKFWNLDVHKIYNKYKFIK